MRLDLDVRRVWRCPTCGRERRTSGDLTMLQCTACSDQPLMSLVEPKRSPRPLRRPLDLLITFDPDESEFPSLDASAAPAETATSPSTEQEAAPETTQPDEQTAPRPRKRQRRRRSRRKSADKHDSDASSAAQAPDDATRSAPSEPSGESSKSGSLDAGRPDPS